MNLRFQVCGMYIMMSKTPTHHDVCQSTQVPHDCKLTQGVFSLFKHATSRAFDIQQLRSQWMLPGKAIRRLTAWHLKSWFGYEGNLSEGLDLSLQGCRRCRRNRYGGVGGVNAPLGCEGVRSGVTRLRCHEDSQVKAADKACMRLHS